MLAKHDGKIWAEANQDKDRCYIFILPKKQA
jgi:signal transduction histidine kinase